jgi:hypothetical protein
MFQILRIKDFSLSQTKQSLRTLQVMGGIVELWVGTSPEFRGTTNDCAGFILTKYLIEKLKNAS